MLDSFGLLTLIEPHPTVVLFTFVTDYVATRWPRLNNFLINVGRTYSTVFFLGVGLFTCWSVLSSFEPGAEAITQTTALRTSKNNCFDKQNNSSARPSHFLVHFIDVHCTTSNATFYAVREHTTKKISFPAWTWIKTLTIQPQENFPTFEKN